ncbi:MMPL family transporter, partial [Streptomyces sp. NPDC127574]
MSEVNSAGDGPGTGPGQGKGKPADLGTDTGGARRADGNEDGRGTGARLGGWTRFVTARPRLSLLVALLLTALAVVAGSGVADRLGSGGWEDPTAESTYATKALEREFPASQPNLLLLLDAGGSSVDDPAVAAEAKRVTARLAAERGVTGVGSYWQSGSPALKARDGHEALIAARITGDETAAADTLDRLAPSFRGRSGPVEVEIGGPVAVRHEMQTTI